jgi:DNA-binding GntR family transcriptional regulator
MPDNLPRGLCATVPFPGETLMGPLADIQARIARTSLADSVYETLLEAIVSGQLTSGTSLSAIALSRQLEVSRTPVQEALRRLEADGLVMAPQGKQARVASFDRQDILEVYAMRAILEPAATALAAGRLTEGQLAELARGLEALSAAVGKVGWTAEAIAYDLAFHDTLAAACGNQRLQADIGRYRLLVRGFCRMTGSEANLQSALEEHRAILAALQARDAGAARDAMERHVRARLAAVLSDKTPGEAR